MTAGAVTTGAAQAWSLSIVGDDELGLSYFTQCGKDSEGGVRMTRRIVKMTSRSLVPLKSVH